MKSMGTSLLFFLRRYYVWVILGLVFFGYVVARAIMVSITHDEVNTSLLYARMSVYDIVTYKDPIPNNHILHTLLVKLSEGIFGISQFSVRIPNLVGFWVYFSATVAFFYACSEKWFVRLFGFVVLLLNPFFVDFFSLARGYALASDFMLMGCYMAYCWLTGGKMRHFVLALVLGILSVYSNFTTLNFFAPFVGLLGLSVFEWGKKQGSVLGCRRFVVGHFVVLFIGCLVLAGISYLPITAMRATDQFRFWGSKGFYEETLRTLVYMSVDGRGYVKNLATTVDIFSVLVCIYLGVLYAGVSINLWNNRFRFVGNPFGFFGLLLFGSIGSVILQYFILGTPYVSSRTALFFYPLFGLASLFFAERLTFFVFRFAYRFYVVLIAFVIWHFLSTVNLKSADEWWYDRDDFIVLDYLKGVYEGRCEKEAIRLDAHWLFLPALHFYEQTTDLYWLKVAAWHTEPRPDGDAEYYYIVSEELSSFSARYEPVMDFDNNARILMRKKNLIQNTEN